MQTFFHTISLRWKRMIAKTWDINVRHNFILGICDFFSWAETSHLLYVSWTPWAWPDHLYVMYGSATANWRVKLPVCLLPDVMLPVKVISTQRCIGYIYTAAPLTGVTGHDQGPYYNLIPLSNYFARLAPNWPPSFTVYVFGGQFSCHGNHV